MEYFIAAITGASIGWLVFLIAVWLSEQEWMQKIWEFTVDSMNRALLLIKWVIGFPAAVVSNYRRQNQIEKQMHDALIDDTFLDRASRG